MGNGYLIKIRAEELVTEYHDMDDWVEGIDHFPKPPVSQEQYIYGQMLKVYRQRGRLSKRTLGRELGIRSCEVLNIERGIRKVPLQIVNKYQDTFGITIPVNFQATGRRNV